MRCASPSGCSRLSTTSRPPITHMPRSTRLISSRCFVARRSRAYSRSSTRLIASSMVVTRDGTVIPQSRSCTRLRRPRETHRRLPRLVRPHHQGSRRSHPPLARVRGSAHRRGRDQRRQAAALLPRGAHRPDSPGRARQARGGAVVRRLARGIRQEGRRVGDHSRIACRLGLRVRVPNGVDESQSRAQDRDRLPGARLRSDLSELQPGARGRALRRRRLAARRLGCPEGPEAQVRQMSFMDRVLERARDIKARVVLAEGDDARVQEAATKIERMGLATVQLLSRSLPMARLPMVALLRNRRPDKFPTEVAALQALAHPLLFGACLVAVGEADVMVGGAVYTSAETIRAALLAVGTAPGIATVSGAFYMTKGDRVLTFARSEEHTSELQSQSNLVCRLLLEK